MAKSQADMIKIGVAAVALLGAGILLLANFTTLFDAKPKGVERSPEEQRQIEEEFKEQQKIQKELEESGEVEIGGA